MSFVDSREISSVLRDSIAPRPMGQDFSDLDIRPRDINEHTQDILSCSEYSIEDAVSWLAVLYLYVTSVFLRYQQLGSSEYYISRPYHRMIISALIPIILIFGIRHPVINLLRTIYYFTVYVHHLVRDRRNITNPLERIQDLELNQVVVRAPVVSDEAAADDFQDARE